MGALTVVCFKWGHAYRPSAVLALSAMVARWYPRSHRFVCVTDDPSGLDGVETYPLWNDYAAVPSPHGAGYPSCYRRLKLFDPATALMFGDRLVCIDLDVVIVGDLVAVWDRPEDFIIWGQSDFPATQAYNGSMWLIKHGARPAVWETFDPVASPRLAKAAGRKGSDQGWIHQALGAHEAVWTTADGVYSFRKDIQTNGNILPEHARIVFFHGPVKPWDRIAQSISWVRQSCGGVHG